MKVRQNISLDGKEVGGGILRKRRGKGKMHVQGMRRLVVSIGKVGRSRIYGNHESLRGYPGICAPA